MCEKGSRLGKGRKGGRLTGRRESKFPEILILSTKRGVKLSSVSCSAEHRAMKCSKYKVSFL